MNISISHWFLSHELVFLAAQLAGKMITFPLLLQCLCPVSVEHVHESQCVYVFFIHSLSLCVPILFSLSYYYSERKTCLEGVNSLSLYLFLETVCSTGAGMLDQWWRVTLLLHPTRKLRITRNFSSRAPDTFCWIPHVPALTLMCTNHTQAYIHTDIIKNKLKRKMFM